MAIKYFETQIGLPPGLLGNDVVEELLRALFERFHWFEPRRYGSAALRGQLDPQKIDWRMLVDYHEQHHELCIAARTDRDFVLLSPTLHGAPPYTGKIVWMTSARSASSPTWRLNHVQQVVEAMRISSSPLAVSSLETDIQAKRWRRVEHDGYQEEVPTVRGYGEGLAGLFWRNFYGPPFVRLFGERLNALPPECVTRLGEELVLVQPYELPTEAGTEAARAREQQLISLLGPECFYDHEHHRPPTRRPVLEPEPGSGP